MPSASPKLSPGKEAKEHLATAYNNYQRYQRLLEHPEDSGWALVVLFYTALHLVQAHAIAKCSRTGATPPINHQERHSYVANNLNRLFAEYRRLREASEMVRYEMRHFSRADVEQFHEKAFEKIRIHLAETGIAWDE